MKHVQLSDQEQRTMEVIRRDIFDRYTDLFAQGSYVIAIDHAGDQVFAIETPGMVGYLRTNLAMDPSTGLTTQEAADYINWHIQNYSPREVATMHAQIQAEGERMARLEEKAFARA